LAGSSVIRRANGIGGMGMKKKTVEIVPGVYMIGGPGVSSGDDCCVYLIESKDELCIIDTGAGKSAGMILEQVKKAGFDLEQVRFIVITHGHIDHFGILLKADFLFMHSMRI
jgi:glyoxylase-like metal-dependent hydrolase (beta-lactamase superfamily II)